jgi:hypothetical protein
MSESPLRGPEVLADDARVVDVELLFDALLKTIRS